MPWFLIFSLLLAIYGLILTDIWITTVGAFVSGFLIAERFFGTEGDAFGVNCVACRP